MSNLAISGMSSLRALNQWISVIDTNLTNTKRIGYKETSVSLSAGSPTNIGNVNTTGISNSIDIPSATLMVSTTRIFDSVQGNLTSTGTNTDFALDGEGYFVIEDKDGQRYATRDGQFHFDNDGYLVTQQGLKVLSAGQDWIRIPISEQFSVDSTGKTVSAVGNNGLSTSVYGNKKLMVVRLPDSAKLHYSKYGFTTFDIGKSLPVDLNNNFKTTMDGLNAGQITSRHSGTPVSNENYFKRDAINGGVNVDISTNQISQALVSSHTFGDFGNSFTFTLNHANNSLATNDFSSIGFNFGISESSLGTTNSNRGLSAGVIKTPSGNRLVIVDENNTPISSTAVGALTGSTYTDTIVGTDTLRTYNDYNYKLSLNVIDGQVTVSLQQNYTQTQVNLTTGASTSLANTISNMGQTSGPLANGNYIDGYQTLGVMNPNSAGNLGGFTLSNSTANASMKIKNLQIKQYGGNEYFDMNVVATKRSNEYAGGNSYKTQYDMVDPDSAENIDTLVRQQYLEESTSTIADTIPQLSNTQRLFSAISKIISVANSLSDDINGLIR